jgi:2-keto-4-pentenoate hydratase
VSRADGYAVQAEVARLSGQNVAGWKIAATSVAGQRHINVDGPIAGRLLADRQVPEGAPISLDGNRMRVGEAEFAFRLARPLLKRPGTFSVEEVLAAVESLHPAIEVPDSRYLDFTRVGGPQLIADTACAFWFMVGAAAPAGWREIDLAAHRVIAYRNHEVAGEGGGFNVLGDPRVALTWLANELRVFGDGLRAGDVVITGTCVTPIAIAPGDHVRMDFGLLGRIEAAFSA